MLPSDVGVALMATISELETYDQVDLQAVDLAATTGSGQGRDGSGKLGELLIARERDRSLGTGRWDMLAEDRI